MLLFKELSYRIVGAAMEVHRTLGPGFLESVYEEVLCYEFTLREIPFERQVELPVCYKGVELGKYYADLVVDKAIVLEIKAVSAFSDRHYGSGAPLPDRNAPPIGHPDQLWHSIPANQKNCFVKFVELVANAFRSR